MFNHAIEDKTQEIIDLLLDEGMDVEEALYVVYSPDISWYELPEEYKQHIFQEIFQCQECGAWFDRKDVGDEELMLCKECI